MAKMQIIGDPFKNLAEQIDRIGGDLRKATDEALRESAKTIQSNLTSAAQPYAGKGRKGYATGEMYRSIIRNVSPTWVGDVAEVNVGFNLRQPGGFHSIFIMYGTPRIAKDTRVYNAIRGAKTKKSVEDVQMKVMAKHLKFGGSE